MKKKFYTDFSVKLSINQNWQMNDVHFGFSIYDYIINLRIIKAKDLLREQIAVSTVCELVGFGSYSNFIRTFSKRVGISPGQYS